MIRPAFWTFQTRVIIVCESHPDIVNRLGFDSFDIKTRSLSVKHLNLQSLIIAKLDELKIRSRDSKTIVVLADG